MDLEIISKTIRQNIFKMACHAGGAHIASSFSIVEILTVLYFEILNIDPENEDYLDRDRFILSKGHASAAIYAVLAERGFFNKDKLKGFCRYGTVLGGHPEMQQIPGIEVSTGSLGHGLPLGAGMAYAAKIAEKKYKTFVLLGDGECQEGSVWETALLASQLKLDNLIAIVDYNGLQAMDKTENIINLQPFSEKWRSFGWDVKEVDGHNISELKMLFKKLPLSENRPSLIVANTVKGKGISYMENVPIWHFRMPKGNEMRQALEELGIEPGFML